jgi:hypothetical protein
MRLVGWFRGVLALAGLLAGLGLADGGAPSKPVYLPLDNRPPSWAPCTWGIATCPPPEVYAGREGADPQRLERWLLDTPGSTLVASLDALAYGGLVQSRQSTLPAGEALSRLKTVITWKLKNGGAVYGFGIIPRHPDAKDRERNLAVLRTVQDWPEALQEGSYFEVPWDDALPGSPAIEEAKTLGLPTRPGADEAGQLMLLRALNPGLRVQVLYDDPAAAQEVIRYDGIPLEDSIARQVRAAGARLVEQNPDLILLAYSGKNPQGVALLVQSNLGQAPVAIADIARVNRGDPKLIDYLLRLRLYPRLAAYTCWGTPANNLGSALAQGGLFLSDPQPRQARLAENYLQYLYGEVGRPWVRERFPEPLREEAARYLFERLKEEPLPFMLGTQLELSGISFPWKRTFEAAFSYQLVPVSLSQGER